MIQRIFAFLLILLRAACGATADDSAEAPVVTAEATAEMTVVSSYTLELSQTHSTPMAWGGRASFRYPADWRVLDSSEGELRGGVTIFGVDNYNLGFSVNNDPLNTQNTVANVLNAMNLMATVETVEREGRSIWTSYTRGGNAWAAGLYVEGTSFALIELVNTRRLDLEPMKETVLAILLSVELSEE